MAEFQKLALMVSDSAKAQEVAQEFQSLTDWVSPEEADIVVVVGGDGFMLQTLHAMLDHGNVKPVYGVNLGTVGFLMNKYRGADKVLQRLDLTRTSFPTPIDF